MLDQGETAKCTWKRRRAHFQARGRPSKRVRQYFIWFEVMLLDSKCVFYENATICFFFVIYVVVGFNSALITILDLIFLVKMPHSLLSVFC